ncbi:hypothetical protein KGQ19_37275 [Catenulispora sp. NL8]|uniref:YD repeat protein n=1 Tax=Catenulispora pinistramenti TaxID=2705254 RepID=A0ABS5L2F6_9ACTN|nr:RHS repeat-associated core domain-containing protein [Catenulispora pinistramenti]MBS2552522.1 hypothetical protein [Catenulispora pinistramenti]
MARPTGWDILGLDGDPTPGVVESVQALAKQFGDFAHDVESAYRSLNSFGSDATAMQWVGQTADAFKANYGPLPGRLQKLYTSYSEASDALSAYAPQLQAAQSKADSALRQAQDANADMQRATTNANSAAADLKTAQQNHAANPNPQAVTDAQTAHDTAQTNLNNAKARMAALTTQANQAHDDRIAAAKTCAKALGHAQADGIHNKSWWQHLGEDLSEWGGKIAEIAGDLAPFLDVLALATSWIPGVDVITAALAEADDIIALVGTGMQIAGDGMQGHWGDALLAAGMLGATYLGGRALEGVGGKLLGKLGDKFGKDAEGEAGALGAAEHPGGVEGCTKAGDPVDVVSGQMIAGDTDLALPGILPLVLRRVYASGSSTGRLFGPGWSSTLDQRLSVNAAGIHFVGDDAQTLHYPVPAAGEEVLPVLGKRWPLVWDREADEIRIVDRADGRTLHFAVVHHSEELGQIRDLTSISDRNGNRIEVLRDTQGTPTTVLHSGGYQVAVQTAAHGDGVRVTGVSLVAGGEGGDEIPVRSYAYDDAGRLTDITDSRGAVQRFEYDGQSRITASIDRLGFGYAYEYDARGRVARGIGDGGYLSADFAYDTATRVTAVTDSLGNVTEYHYDESRNVTALIDAEGRTLRFEQDRFGRLLAGTDQVGNTTRYEIDEQGDVVVIERPDGSTVSVEYNEFGQETLIGLPDGTRWHRSYDERGNLIAETDPLGARTTYEIDEHGAISAVVDALGHRTTYTTDAHGLPLTTVYPDGAAEHVVRDTFGRSVSFTNVQGQTSNVVRDTEGGLVAQTLADGTTQTWERDAAGNVVSHSDAAGNLFRFEIGPFQRLVAQIRPDGARYGFAYDTELRMTSVTGPGNVTWDYQYGPAAAVPIAESDFDGVTTGYRYDAAGRLLVKTRGNAAQSIAYDYDALGRVTRQTTGEGAVTEFAYDPLGRVMAARSDAATVEFTRDPLGRVVAESVDGRVTRNEYDALGRRIRRTTPTGLVSTWTFDAAHRARSLASDAGVMAFEYDAVGHETARRLGGGGAVAQAWDAAGRLTDQTVHAADPNAPESVPGLTQRRQYTYRPDGYPVAIADLLRGERRITNDSVGRVTAVEGGPSPERYAYDSLGNLVSANYPAPDDDAAGARDFRGTLPRAAGRVSYEHDERGRLVRVIRRTLDGRRRQWTYSWDADDRLVTASTPDDEVWHYRYDPLGRRIGKQRLDAAGVTVGEVLFSWDGDKLAERATQEPGHVVKILTWDWQPGQDRCAAQTIRVLSDGGQVISQSQYAVVGDTAGTPRELVAEDGQIAWQARATLWGVRSAGPEDEVTCPLGFPGQYHDAETGLEYNHFRYYDPETARYVSPDPLGLEAAPNNHAYVPNPLSWIDPLGLVPAGSGKDGGWYGALQPAGSGYEINHIPAKNVTKSLGGISMHSGPAIRMELDDHYALYSTRSSLPSQAWRQWQKELLGQGKITEVMQMDIDDIRNRFGTKYDGAIQEMIGSLKHNQGFQDFLTQHNMTIQYCKLG